MNSASKIFVRINSCLFGLIILLLAIIISCKKESVGTDSSTFIKTFDTDVNYMARNCFELNDKNYVICGERLQEEFPGVKRAVIAKVSPDGNLIWRKEISLKLYDLIKGIPISGGGFALIGCDSIANSKNITVAVYDDDGILLHEKTIYNDWGINGSQYYNTPDMIQLQNGNLAISLTYASNVFYPAPKILILDTSLNEIINREFTGIDSAREYRTAHLQENSNGDLYLFGIRNKYDNINDAWVNFSRYIIKLNPIVYDINFIKDSVAGNSIDYSNSFVLDNNENLIISSIKQFNPDQTTFVVYRNGEGFSIGTSVAINKTDANGNLLSSTEYSGFPLLAAITKIARTADGGSIMVGLCNRRENVSSNSLTYVLLIKTDVNQKKEWMRIIKTSYPSIGFDVEQTNDGGYLVGASIKSFDNYYKMMLIKTDANGN